MARRGTSRIVLGLTATVLMASALAGCSSSGAIGGRLLEWVSRGGTVVRLRQVAALEFAALPEEERQAQLQAVTESLDRQLIAMSGLEAELGGAAKADAAYTTSNGTWRRARSTSPWSVRRVRSDRGRSYAGWPDVRQLSGGSLAAGRGGRRGQGCGAPARRRRPRRSTWKDPPAGGKADVIFEGDLGKSSLGMEESSLRTGSPEKLKTVVTVAPCPDPKGEFTSTTTMTASIVSGRGTGSNLMIEMKIKGQVDDDAQLVSYDLDTRTESAQFANGKGVYADQSVGWRTTGDVAGNYRAKVNRTGGAVTRTSSRTRANGRSSPRS